MEWRREWDSNPRYPFEVHALSRRVPSAARPSLREARESNEAIARERDSGRAADYKAPKNALQHGEGAGRRPQADLHLVHHVAEADASRRDRRSRSSRPRRDDRRRAAFGDERHAVLAQHEAEAEAHRQAAEHRVAAERSARCARARSARARAGARRRARRRARARRRCARARARRAVAVRGGDLRGAPRARVDGRRGRGGLLKAAPANVFGSVMSRRNSPSGPRASGRRFVGRGRRAAAEESATCARRAPAPRPMWKSSAERLRDVSRKKAPRLLPRDAAHHLADQPAEGQRVVAVRVPGSHQGSCSASADGHRVPVVERLGGSGLRDAGRPAWCESSQRTGIALLARLRELGPVARDRRVEVERPALERAGARRARSCPWSSSRR